MATQHTPNEQLTSLATRIAYQVGDAFFSEVITAFSQIFDVPNVWITESMGASPKRMKTLACYRDQEMRENVEYDLAGTPCEIVIKEGFYVCGDRLQEAFSVDQDLFGTDAEAYGGICLFDSHGKVIGHVCYCSGSELTTATWQLPALKMIQDRCGAEIERMRSERNRIAEMKMIEDTKHLASLGTLTAGIAHEINNPLTTIQLAAEMALLESEKKRPATASNLNAILESVTSISHIVDGVLRVATNKQALKSKCDLKELIFRAIEVVSPKTSLEQVAVVFHDAQESFVIGNPLELQQVFVNLITNAIHATDDQKKPVEITIAKKSAAYVIEVSNYGAEIAVQDRELIFEPFYTTRRKQGGTGLGLSVSKDIVVAHKGEISVCTNKENTTTLVVTLPAFDGQDE